jgi:hypothetical protein
MAPVPYTHIPARALAITFSQDEWIPFIPYPSGYYSCMANLCRTIIILYLPNLAKSLQSSNCNHTEQNIFNPPCVDRWLEFDNCYLLLDVHQLRKRTDLMHVGKVIGRLGEVRLSFSDTVVLHRNVFWSQIYKAPWATRGLSQIWGVDYIQAFYWCCAKGQHLSLFKY